MGHCLQDLVCSKCKEVNHRNQCQEEWSICFVILGDSIQHGKAVQVRGGLQAHPGGQGHGSVGQHLQGNSSSLSVRVVVENLVTVILIPDGVIQDAVVDGASGMDTQDEPKAGQAPQVRGLGCDSQNKMPQSSFIQGSGLN